ncbi:MAG: hypothetical protein LBT63_02400 [Holosporaceae bacterium]|jgi:hypothetical protein|nr:hypothetical protein [Holosporaceae bacterium]
MYALCGENGVKIFDGERQLRLLSYGDFLLLPRENYQIVLDLRSIDFSLEKLTNCSLTEAHRILHCQKKALSNDEIAFLVRSDQWNFFKKSAFYIQKNSFKYCKFFHQLSAEDGIFLMENVVAEFCESIAPIDAETWWLYAAEHEFGNLRIIAGIGRGVVFSRFLYHHSDASKEIFKTIVYLKRFGLEKTIKIITPLREIDSSSNQNISFEIFTLKEHGEPKLMSFLSHRKKMKRIFVRRNWLAQCLDMERSYHLASSAVLVLVFAILILHREISSEEQKIMELEKTVIVGVQNFRLKINIGNFCFLKQFVETLKNSCNPLEKFEKASRFCRENSMLVEQLCLENCSSVQIKTLLDKKEFETLQKLNRQGLEISLEKLETVDGEYEELGTDRKFGVLACIRIK